MSDEVEKPEPTLKDAIDGFEKMSNRMPEKWFGTGAMFMLLCLVFGSAILYTTSMWAGMTERFDNVCELFCSACGYESHFASSQGGCSCYGELAPAWCGPEGCRGGANLIIGNACRNLTVGMRNVSIRN